MNEKSLQIVSTHTAHSAQRIQCTGETCYIFLRKGKEGILGMLAKNLLCAKLNPVISTFELNVSHDRTEHELKVKLVHVEFREPAQIE